MLKQRVRRNLVTEQKWKVICRRGETGYFTEMSKWNGKSLIMWTFEQKPDYIKGAVMQIFRCSTTMADPEVSVIQARDRELRERVEHDALKGAPSCCSDGREPRGKQ